MDLYLRAFEIDDCQALHRWRVDDEVKSLTAGPKRFISADQTRRWIENKTEGHGIELYLAICLVSTDELIGYCSLIDIDVRNGSAEWGGMIIGAKDQRGRGYGTQAAYQLLAHAFDELRLHRVAGQWLAEHEKSIALGERLGFQKEGILRDAVYKNGRFRDVLLASLLDVEFQAIRDTIEAQFRTL